MANVATRGNRSATYDDAAYDTADHVSGWTSWVGFAGFMMIATGMLHVIDGLIGIFRSSFYLVSNNSSQLVVFQNVKTWAWINLIAGAIVMLAGFSLFSGTTWSRIIAVMLAFVSIAINLLAISLYPIWSIIAIALAVLVIYAVTVHGDELRHA
jgi:hypothetical protein